MMLRDEFQEIINRMFFGLAGTKNFDDIFNAISGSLIALPGIHTVIVRHAGDTMPECGVMHIAGLLTADDLHEESGRRVCRWVVQEGQPLLIPDTRIDPRVDCKKADPRIRSVISWPVRVNEKISYVIFLLGDRAIEFTWEERNVLDVVAEASGYWLSYLQLRDEAGQTRRRLVALEEVSRILNSTLELKTILNMMIDLSVNLFEIDLSCIYLLDKDSGRFDLKVARGSNEVILKRMIRRFDGEREADGLTDFPVMAEDELLGYLTLGNGPADFPDKDRELVNAFANLAGISIRNSLLFAERQKSYRQTVNALSLAIEARDKYLHGHTAKVSEFAVALGRKLGLGELELQDLETAGILHDIGKLGVSETVLNKYGEFTDNEFAEFKRHTVIGAGIVEALEDFSHLVPAIRHHHEKYDGTGYPDGLTGEDIPLQARIIAIADSFAALTAVRPHCTPRNSFEALKIIRDDAGAHYDPRLVKIFEKVVQEKYSLRIDRLDNEELPAAADRQILGDTDLTERELEILGLIAAGLNNKEISDALYLSEKTVKTHVSNILRKLNLTDRTKAAVYAIKNGLVTWVEL